jgi:phosphoglycolate phosphatase-like HAD superfamily hydrolase
VTLPADVTSARLVIWDFDGVIKDSVDVKTRAFVDLFDWAGPDVQASVAAHHEANGGMSRFDKLPRYLEMAGESPTPERVATLCDEFSHRVLQCVVDAPWVPGVEEYLRTNPHQQQFALVSATPLPELEIILDRLALRRVFVAVHGAPMSKTEAVGHVLTRLGVQASESVFLGDALADQLAADTHGVPFVLRRHATNAAVFSDYNGPAFQDFSPA